MWRPVIVRDLCAPDTTLIYLGVTPKRAVLCAYAQSLGDWNTWGYETRYGQLVTEGRKTVACGDFCARKWDDTERSNDGEASDLAD